MTYSVTFDKSITLSADPAFAPSPVRAQLTVTGVVGFSDLGVFTFMINQVTNTPEYNHVATPQDLQDYNFQVPGDDTFVRESAIDLYYETASAAEDGLEDIEARILLLCNDMDTLDDFGTPVSVTISST